MLLLHAMLNLPGAGTGRHLLAGNAPDPAPQAPPGLQTDVNTLLGWWKWIALTAGVFGLIGCGAMMAIGCRTTLPDVALDMLSRRSGALGMPRPRGLR